MAKELDGFSDKDHKKPISQKKLNDMALQAKAISIYARTGDEQRVAEELGVPKTRARVLINRGIERWESKLPAHINRVRVEQDKLLEDMLYELANRFFEEGEYQRSDQILKIMERRNRLLGRVDAEKESNDKGGTYIVKGDVNIQNIEIPEGARVVDTRKPWERTKKEIPEVIEGEAVEDE